ncbi:MAG TPA: hypothetical protein VGL61_21075 [Kofleriaceae bacterium]|jgi:hypothetical protein|nr:hypothetical protein [Polyangiales bacterium]
MGKWIATIAGFGIVVLAILAWLQLHDTSKAIAAKAPPPAPVPVTASPSQLATLGAQIKQAEKTPDGKLSPNSDEFFYKFSEAHTKRLTKLAATCYKGGIDRVGWNDFLRLTLRDKIVKGEVFFTDVKIMPDSTMTDQSLIDCFVNQVKTAHWHDDTLPDIDDEDELVLRPERGMKKYTHPID